MFKYFVYYTMVVSVVTGQTFCHRKIYNGKTKTHGSHKKANIGLWSYCKNSEGNVFVLYIQKTILIYNLTGLFFHFNKYQILCLWNLDLSVKIKDPLGS